MALSRRTSYPILGLLTERPMSGYDLKKAIEATFGHFWSESYGQIYPALKQLSQEGLIRRQSGSAGSEAGGNVPRRIWRLTPQGAASLRNWLQEPARRQVERNELLLKVYLAAGSDRVAARRHLQDHREATGLRRDLLAGIEGRLRRLTPETPELVGWLISVRYGVMEAEAGLRWCDEALELLSPELSPSS